MLDEPQRDRRRTIVLAAAAIVAVIVVGWLVLGGGGGGTDVASLEAGTCFGPARERLDVSVDRQSCSAAHDAELVIVLRHPAPEGAEFPGADELELFGAASCQPVIADRVGEPLAALEQAGIEMIIAVPDGEGWDEGERRLACSLTGTVERLDSGLVTRS